VAVDHATIVYISLTERRTHTRVASADLNIIIILLLLIFFKCTDQTDAIAKNATEANAGMLSMSYGTVSHLRKICQTFI